MGSNISTDQVHDDSQTLGKYPIRVMVRVKVKLLMEKLYELRIIIN